MRWSVCQVEHNRTPVVLAADFEEWEEGENKLAIFHKE